MSGQNTYSGHHWTLLGQLGALYWLAAHIQRGSIPGHPTVWTWPA